MSKNLMNSSLYSRICSRLDNNKYKCDLAHDDIVDLLTSYRRLHEQNKRLQNQILNRIESWIACDKYVGFAETKAPAHD